MSNASLPRYPEIRSKCDPRDGEYFLSRRRCCSMHPGNGNPLRGCTAPIDPFLAKGIQD